MFGVHRLDLKIDKLDEQLAKLRDQINRTRPGPAQEATKRRALQVFPFSLFRPPIFCVDSKTKTAL